MGAGELTAHLVMYKDILSSTSCIKAGVPKGSVLGPLLSLLYVYDFSEKMLSFCRLFWWWQLYTIFFTKCIMYWTQSNHDLLVLEQWSSKWLLKFNQSKTKAVFFTLKSSYELFNIVNSNTSRRTKHLGLHLDSDLKWANHITFIVNKAYNIGSPKKNLKFNLGKNTLSNIYSFY